MVERDGARLAPSRGTGIARTRGPDRSWHAGRPHVDELDSGLLERDLDGLLVADLDEQYFVLYIDDPYIRHRDSLLSGS